MCQIRYSTLSIIVMIAILLGLAIGNLYPSISWAEGQSQVGRYQACAFADPKDETYHYVVVIDTTNGLVKAHSSIPKHEMFGRLK